MGLGNIVVVAPTLKRIEYELPETMAGIRKVDHLGQDAAGFEIVCYEVDCSWVYICGQCKREACPGCGTPWVLMLDVDFEGQKAIICKKCLVKFEEEFPDGHSFSRN